jgi:citrate lyase subunit beta/citryl-CoA lyase
MITIAAASAADVVVLDLEDSVAPDQKPYARAQAIGALLELDWGTKARAVRVNARDTEWADQDVIDLVTQAVGVIDLLVIPKVSAPNDLLWADDLLNQVERQSRNGQSVGLAALIEDARGVQGLDEIVQSTDRLEALILGAGDLARSLRLRPGTGDELENALEYARLRVLYAARAGGIDPVDGPYFGRVDDHAGFRRSAIHASVTGFAGKWAIHPDQIAIANEAFSPTAQETDQARRVVDAYQEAQADGRGAIRLDGRMIDAAHARAALDLLEIATSVDAANSPRRAPPTDAAG